MFIKYKNFLLAIANCGIMTKHLAKKYYNLHHKTLNALVKNNTLEIKGNLLLYGKVSTIYTLSENAKKVIRKNGKSPYKTNTSQLEHDYLLLKSYCSLPIQVQHTWLNETELKQIYTSSATTDGMFIINNKHIGLEVLTSNYTSEMIDSKIKFGTQNCSELITLNTSDIKYK